MNISIIISAGVIFIFLIILIIIVGKYKNKINILNKTVSEKETDIKNINFELTEYKNKLSEKESDYNKVETELKETNIKLEEKEETINKHQKAIDKHKKVLDILSDQPEKNESTEAFHKIRNVYNDLINKCIEYDLPSGKLFKNFDELLEKIEEAINFPLFYHKNIIALCGQFSSGKTSMINSFLKDNILPTSIEPTTAINTFVVYEKDNDLYIRNCFSGQTKVDKELYQFVTHAFTKEYDKDVHNMVKYVSLHTQKLKYENIALLDTPGYTGQGTDATEDDSNMAMKGIAQADNIVWVVSMENGTIKNNDLEFLEKEELNGKDILIVFNKADIQSEEDIDKIVEESKIQLDSRGIDYKDIVVYSSKYPEDYKEGEKKLFNFFESENNSIERNYLEDLNKIFDEFVKYYKDMDEDLAIYTEALNVTKIKSAFSSIGAKNKSIDSSIKNVKENRLNIKNFINDLKTNKEKCLDLLKVALYKNREECNRHNKKMLENEAKKKTAKKTSEKKAEVEEINEGSGIFGMFKKVLEKVDKSTDKVPLWKPNAETTSNKNNLTLIDEIKDVIAAQLNITDKSKITNTASLVDDLNADSLDLVELVMELEKRYDIKIPQEDQEKIRNILDVVEYIEDNKKKIEFEDELEYEEAEEEEYDEDENNAELEEAESVLEDAKSEVESTEETLEEAEKELEEAEDRLSEAESVLEDAESEFENAKDEVENIKSEIKDAEAEVKEAEETLEEAEKELEEAEDRLSEAESVLEDAESEFENAKEEVENIKSEVKDAETEVKDAEKELKEAEKVLEEVEDRLSEAESVLEDAESKFENAKDEVENIKSEIKDAETEVKEAEKELKKAEKILEEAEDKLNQLY